MPIRLRQKIHQERIHFDANRRVGEDIPQDRPIRRIIAKIAIRASVAAASTAPTGRKNGHYTNLIKAFEITMDGTDQKIFYDLPMKMAVDTFEMGAEPYQTETISNPAAGGHFTYVCNIPIDFAQARKNLNDYSALLNAPAIGSLKFNVHWGDASDIWATVGDVVIDEDHTHVELTYVEVFDNVRGAPDLRAALENLIDIRETVATPQEIDQARSSFGTDEQSIKIEPVPALILTHVFNTQNNLTDGNPADSNDIVNHFSIENIRGQGEPILLDRWKNWHEAQKLQHNLESNPPVGFNYINWAMQRQGGLRNDAVDALKLKILTEAPTANKKNGLRIFTRSISGAVRLEGRV